MDREEQITFSRTQTDKHAPGCDTKPKQGLVKAAQKGTNVYPYLKTNKLIKKTVAK